MPNSERTPEKFTNIKFKLRQEFVPVFERELLTRANKIVPRPGEVNQYRKHIALYHTIAEWRNPEAKNKFWGYWNNHLRLGNIIKREEGGFNDFFKTN